LNADYHTFYIMSWEKRQFVRNLRMQGYEVVSIEHITRGKVVIVARDRFRWQY